MNVCLLEKDYKLAIEAAKGAAPYVHSRKGEDTTIDKEQEQSLPPMTSYLADHEVIVQSLTPSTASNTKHDH